MIPNGEVALERTGVRSPGPTLQMSLYADKTHQNLGGGSFLAVRQVVQNIDVIFVRELWCTVYC